MSQTQSSEQTESLESTITSLYKARFHPGAKITANNKLFYRKYPHVITFGTKMPDMRWDSESMHRRREQLYELERHLRRYAFNYSKFRNEWVQLRVYTMNPTKLLGGLPSEFMGMIAEVSIMKDEILEHLKTKPENTFRTVNTVVKKLPFGKYRYRTHYATDGRDKRKIGKDALETIAANLSIYPGIRWNDRLTDRVTMIRSTWDATYFYSEDVDWITMVNLVDSRFIKKIEYFTVEKELDKESN